jgi:hypothetical protein
MATVARRPLALELENRLRAAVPLAASVNDGGQCLFVCCSFKTCRAGACS